jgi:hypothetical protein
MTPAEREWIYLCFMWCMGDITSFPPEPQPDSQDELWAYVDLLLALSDEWDRIPLTQHYMLKKRWGLVP